MNNKTNLKMKVKSIGKKITLTFTYALLILSNTMLVFRSEERRVGKEC